VGDREVFVGWVSRAAA